MLEFWAPERLVAGSGRAGGAAGQGQRTRTWRRLILAVAQSQCLARRPGLSPAAAQLCLHEAPLIMQPRPGPVPILLPAPNPQDSCRPPAPSPAPSPPPSCTPPSRPGPFTGLGPCQRQLEERADRQQGAASWKRALSRRNILFDPLPALKSCQESG